jgi:hypothetical protein
VDLRDLREGKIPAGARCVLVVNDLHSEEIKEIIAFWNLEHEYAYKSKGEREHHYLTTYRHPEGTVRLRWYPYVLPLGNYFPKFLAS